MEWVKVADKIVGVLGISGTCESWQQVYLLDGLWDNDELYETFNLGYFYGGPGRTFYNHPSIERNGFSTLVHITGGLDI